MSRLQPIPIQKKSVSFTQFKCITGLHNGTVIYKIFQFVFFSIQGFRGIVISYRHRLSLDEHVIEQLCSLLKVLLLNYTLA